MYKVPFLKILSAWALGLTLALAQAVADPFAAFGIPAAPSGGGASNFAAAPSGDPFGAAPQGNPFGASQAKAAPKKQKTNKTTAVAKNLGNAAFGMPAAASGFGAPAASGGADWGSGVATGGFDAPVSGGTGFGAPAASGGADWGSGGAGAGGFGAPAAVPSAPADTGGGLLGGLKDVLGAVKEGIKTAKDIKESTSGLSGGSSGNTSSFGTGF